MDTGKGPRQLVSKRYVGGKKCAEQRQSAREKYLSGKMSPERYAEFIISQPNGDHVLNESAAKVRRINRNLEKKRLLQVGRFIEEV